MRIHFHKYHGCGNDFIVVDGRSGRFNGLRQEVVARLCHRRFGVGADGLMVLAEAPGQDFSMLYWNADGNPGSMCGNGARCIVAFAHRLGVGKGAYRFLAPDGPHEAYREEDGIVRLRMSDVGPVERVNGDHVLDTGSPHYVRFTDDVRRLDVEGEGRTIRHSQRFQKEGINVNFVQRLDGQALFVRTFERGVEAETLSCGTGVTASALVSADGTTGNREVEIRTRGGRLRVDFEARADGSFHNVWLVGPAAFVYSGEVDTDDLNPHPIEGDETIPST